MTTGATDLAGNPLAAVKTWSFTTSTVPAAPSNLTTVRSGAVGDQRVTLTWADNSTNEAKFVIERATAQDFSANLVIVEVGAGVTSYVDTQLQAVTKYYYRVKAVNGLGEASAYSNVSTSTTK